MPKKLPSVTPPTHQRPSQRIWWSNATFFVSIHVGAMAGVFYFPPSSTPRQTLLLALITWQLATFGITIGYHRLWSHRSFEANFGVRLVLAILGTMGFQGSVKWWCLRHRLHHRYTDDPIHDPYAATRGMFYAHMGWIFFKPNYERMSLIDRSDLENDTVVKLQHTYYVPLALITGFIFPVAVGTTWDDPWGAFVWGGLVSRVMIWHCIFLVNSLAHYDGLQPYTDENTSKTNWIVAILVAGEGNHNYHHAFPYDYRSDPSLVAWDPSKWLIAVLQKFGCVKGVRLAGANEVHRAATHMKHVGGSPDIGVFSADVKEMWTMNDALKHASTSNLCLLLIDGYFVNVTEYTEEHPGGTRILDAYSLPGREAEVKDATEAFHGGVNQHSQAARWKMIDLRVAKLVE